MNKEKEQSWLEKRLERILCNSKKLWKKKKEKVYKWSIKRPGVNWYRASTMYEDELPEDISDEQYDWWFKNSIVDFVRIGPEVRL